MINYRRVRRNCAKGTQKSDCLKMNEDGIVDWTRLPNDTVVSLFTRLNYRDRASLSSTCTSWRSVGSSSCLWQSLDLRAHKCDWGVMHSLASRCSNLQKLRIRATDDTDSLVILRAKNLKELSLECSQLISDSTLIMIVAGYKLLESIQLGPHNCEMITSKAIADVALRCRKLKKLRLSGLAVVHSDAITALANRCPDLHEIAFADCLSIDEAALGNVVSLRFLSVAGTANIDWNVVGECWCKLPYLEGLDVSRTAPVPAVVRKLILSLKSLKLLCAFDCPSLEEETALIIKANHLGIMIFGFFNNTFTELSRMFPGTFSDWRNRSGKKDEFMTWVEWMLSHSLLHLAKLRQPGLDQFWVNQGADLLLNLLQSSQEDVQEWAAIGLANFAVGEDLKNVDVARAEAVIKGGGVELLLGLATSFKEGITILATKAIANLSMNPAFAKSVAGGGGITILASLVKSMNRRVVREAAGGIWNLSLGDEHKIKRAIAETGAIKALVDLTFNWPRGADGVLERAVGALANLATDDKCSMEIAAVGGINALVTLARKCKRECVQSQAARALANLTAHRDGDNIISVGQEDGAIDALVLLLGSLHEDVRHEAAGALWNLSLDERNQEWIALAGGVEALVDLAHTCLTASPSLQERAAGALWTLSASEANSIAIGQKGGINALILLAISHIEAVHATAAGALWNLAFNPGNAMRIVEAGGILILFYLCSSTSKMARFMAVLALANMLDGRVDVRALVAEGGSKLLKIALKHIENGILTFVNRQDFTSASLSSASTPLEQATKSARIVEARQLRCNQPEIERFVSMLRNKFPVLKSCAAFALFQLTVPGGRYARHHVNLLQELGASRALRVASAAAAGPLEAKVFARMVLRNMEHLQKEVSV